MAPRIDEPRDAVRIQRYFRVSWSTALVRLRQMNGISQATYDSFRKSVRPVGLARSLGYTVDPEERNQDPERWRLRHFPRPFLRMLRDAVVKELMSPPTAASFAGIALPEIAKIVGELPTEEEGWALVEAEFDEFEDTGVI